ncbi:hypothetical protein LCGC14_2107810 [marine sediment metagenome]|uniref:Uncharacterized protein n=1 Tax=marine sediment metagenome TaxID=412755 RepID=A0A0F9E859_9ZZZZ
MTFTFGPSRRSEPPRPVSNVHHEGKTRCSRCYELFNSDEIKQVDITDEFGFEVNLGLCSKCEKD